MKEGRILKALGGFFFVHCPQEDKVYRCGIRGRLKQAGIDVISGDLVEFTLLEDGSGIVESRKQRDNYIFRPPIANVERVIITSAIKEPDLHPKLLDRLLILAENAGLDIIICINKVDISGLEEAKNILSDYERVGYKVIYTSVKEEIGINQLRDVLQDKVSFFAGPSGAGKSSLLNAIQPGLQLKMGEVSCKIKRGRHTTRHVELLALDNGGWVADTPGFSVLDITSIESNELQYLFPEMDDYLDGCKFIPCSHSHEPKCAIKEGVKGGGISESRYQNYLEFLEEIKKKEEKSWRR
ncbi:ribosome small subunit-dependent GTPase A [Halonatronum saccharophilum]|uniref:ribosome small subunit-dependent GTPase A n=1 Tax=Halonatronum saccharophilum TaxID=150060 RepID=UPI000480397C|nr:ribosome small subunit-dependent GTPase A [Halonatronum saccharophilum]